MIGELIEQAMKASTPETVQVVTNECWQWFNVDRVRLVFDAAPHLVHALGMELSSGFCGIMIGCPHEWASVEARVSEAAAPVSRQPGAPADHLLRISPMGARDPNPIQQIPTPAAASGIAQLQEPAPGAFIPKGWKNRDMDQRCVSATQRDGGTCSESDQSEDETPIVATTPAWMECRAGDDVGESVGDSAARELRRSPYSPTSPATDPGERTDRSINGEGDTVLSSVATNLTEEHSQRMAALHGEPRDDSWAAKSEWILNLRPGVEICPDIRTVPCQLPAGMEGGTIISGGIVDQAAQLTYGKTTQVGTGSLAGPDPYPVESTAPMQIEPATRVPSAQNRGDEDDGRQATAVAVVVHDQITQPPSTNRDQAATSDGTQPAVGAHAPLEGPEPTDVPVPVVQDTQDPEQPMGEAGGVIAVEREGAINDSTTQRHGHHEGILGILGLVPSSPGTPNDEARSATPVLACNRGENQEPEGDVVPPPVVANHVNPAPQQTDRDA